MGCGGGGIHCYGNNSTPRITYNQIYDNTAANNGGGILAYMGCTPNLINNTIALNQCTTAISGGGGVCSIGLSYNSSINGCNNIIYGNRANSNPEWYGYWNGYVDLDYTCSSNLLSGTGNITDNPQFVDPLNWDFHLLASSPCIDAGDPSSPLDPDSTRADMGALCFDQSGAYPHVTIVLTYVSGSPIPPAGGPIIYNATITNNEADSITFDSWINVTLPTGSEITLANRQLTTPGGAVIMRTLTVNVPGNTPSGQYTLTGYTGDYPNTVWDQSSFDFTKLGPADASAPNIGGLTLSGFEESWEEVAKWVTPIEQKLLEIYPNPFNPRTQLRYTLPQAGHVSLTIYDVRGREVARLVDRSSPAGEYTAFFDGAHYPSGVYVACLNAGEFQQTQKLILIQ